MGADAERRACEYRRVDETFAAAEPHRSMIGFPPASSYPGLKNFELRRSAAAGVR